MKRSRVSVLIKLNQSTSEFNLLRGGKYGTFISTRPGGAGADSEKRDRKPIRYSNLYSKQIYIFRHVFIISASPNSFTYLYNFY